MALVSGGKSTLNPNAPLFIPASVRQVEDFSPEWWELITTSTWFQDYWLSQHQEDDGFFINNEDDFDGNDIAELLPDTIDLVVDEDFSNMEAYFEEFTQLSETGEANKLSSSSVKGMTENGQKTGLGMDAEALMKSLGCSNPGKKRGPKSLVVPTKYGEKPARFSGPLCSPRRIQQPR